MTEHVARRDPDRAPMHPGAAIEDILLDLDTSKSEIARLLGISRQQLYDILAQKKPVTAATAVRLGKLFGDGAAIWLRMQAAYDAWHAEREIDVSGIPTLQSPL